MCKLKIFKREIAKKSIEIKQESANKYAKDALTKEEILDIGKDASDKLSSFIINNGKELSALTVFILIMKYSAIMGAIIAKELYDPDTTIIYN